MLSTYLALASFALFAAALQAATPVRATRSASDAPEATSGNGLEVGYLVQPVCNGITTTANGRAFLCFPRPDGGGNASVCEVLPDGTIRPYPDVATHLWKPGQPAADKIVRANSIRIVGDELWVCDVGSPKQDEPVVKGGPKLVAIDLKTNKVARVIALDNVTKEKSFLDDLRVGDRSIYATDAGPSSALIVIDRMSGKARRVLEDHPSTRARDMKVDGQVLRKPSGEKVAVHADQLEVNADGSILYFMPCSGPSWQIPTAVIDDPKNDDAELAKHVRPFYDNPTIGGTAIDAAGNVYFADADNHRILRVTPDGTPTTLVEDKTRLQWPDAMWIDHDGNLWIPCPQMHRGAGMNDLVEATRYPIAIFKLKIDQARVDR